MENPAEICKEHPGNPLSYVCFYEHCSKTALACVFCIKRTHAGCADKSIVYRRDLPRIHIQMAENQAVKESLLKIYKEKSSGFVTELGEIQKFFFSFLDLKNLNEHSTESEIQSVRRIANVVKEDDRLRFAITDKLNPKNIEAIEAKFSKELDAQFRRFSQALREIKISSGAGALTPEAFLCHDSIKCAAVGDGLEFTTGQVNQGYYSAFFALPETHGRYTLRVDALDLSQRWLDMGVIEETAFGQYKNSRLTGWYVAGTWVYGGTSHNQLQGKGIVTDYADANGIDIGQTYTIEFDAASTDFRVTDTRDLVDMKGTLPSDKRYHFYFVLYYPNMKIFVKKDS